MNEELFEKIDRYFNGELSLEEQQQFELELTNSHELVTACNLYKTIETEMAAICRHSDEKAILEESLRRLNKIYFKNDTNEGSTRLLSMQKEHPLEQIKPALFRKNGGVIKRVRIWQRWMVAAAVTGIIVLSAVWYVNSTKNTPGTAVKVQKTDGLTPGSKPDTTRAGDAPLNNLAENNGNEEGVNTKGGKYKLSSAERTKLYVLNFKPDPGPDNQEGPLEDAFDYYRNKDYKNAIAAFQRADMNIILRGQKTDKKTSGFYRHYYTAQSYMATSNPARAIPELEKSILVSPDISRQHAARWYLALAYLKTGDLEKAEELLEQIAASDKKTTYRSKAGVLMRKLNE